MTRVCLFFLFLTACFTTRAQINFQFIPELHGRSVDGLGRLNILNGGAPVSGATLTVKVSAKGKGEVLKLKAVNIALSSGLNTLSPLAISNAVIQFYSTPLAAIVRQSNLFPEADYDFCYSLEASKVSGSALLGEDCFTERIAPLSPLALVEPYDRQRLCDPKPAFVWQPVFPTFNGLLYQLTLCEVKAGQTPTEALFYNIPLLNVRNLTTAILPYPPSARDLDTSKKYVWQVAAYKNDLILSRSEVWTFHFGCDPVLPVAPAESFRNIEDLVKGNFYMAAGRILFALQNPYTEMNLDYMIECLTDPGLKLKRLPTIALKRGRNNIVVPLEDSRFFKDNYKYIMTIKTPGGMDRLLRFTYKAAD
jgi:hypothetical protein